MFLTLQIATRRTLPHVTHNFEDTKGQDKIIVLRNILDRNLKKMKRTIIFCNTIDSCRAVEYAINEDENIVAASYHGDLNSKERESNLDKFRKGIVNFYILHLNVKLQILLIGIW